ncbi:hypothetical protein [Cellulomonas marina]|uniref:CYTH domain-containing protein n=1 Tax=Cellulomonas marina TaxID=988821 RepID=A0A1I0YR08_9CELL|nr:hypothetical protein [Cellulomonas marina]GIG27568.1 hypothetical protein Cma02nite_01680 [Cellulomonas marina]SFB15641.1 CYTH domain-containing protein [Cellulomonas marina]
MSDGGNGDFEFERRFFVRELPLDLLDGSPALVVQSYLLADEGWAVRVRVQVPAVDVGALGGGPGGPTDVDPRTLLERWAGAVDFAAVTVKGPMVEGTRYEAERELDPLVGVELVRRGGAVVGKWRHAAWLGDDGWVVDVFVGADAPLVVAEVERGGPVTDLTVPAFCTTEVTTDGRFANDALAHQPYGGWAGRFEAELAARGPVFLEGLGHNHLDGGARG